MRLLLLSDVHAYADALDRVLADAVGSWDEVVLLGDVVGYGPDPVRTVDRLRELPLRATVQGNHEAMFARLLGGRPPRAAEGVVRTLRAHAEALSNDQIAFLEAFEPQHVDDAWAAVHGSPRERFAYLLSVPDARSNEPHMPRDLVFVGHTHVPGGYVKEDDAWRVVPVRGGERSLTVSEGAKAFVNPGSVGPARDGGEGAAYATYDEDARTVVWRRGI